MTNTLLDTIKTQLTPEMVQRLGVLLDETPATMQKAVDGVLPTLLAGVMHFSASGSGATQLIDLLTHGDYGNVLNNLSGLLDAGNTAEKMMNSGRNILNLVFAGKLPAVNALITTHSGIKSSAASSLLSISAPVVFGVIARARAERSLNAVGLATLLLGQRQSVARLAPAGLETILELHSGPTLGIGRAGITTATVANNRTLMVSERQGIGDTRPPWRWLGLGIVAISMGYWLWRQGPEVTTPLVSPLVSTMALAPAFSPPVPNVTLPGGAALFLKEGSSTYTLAMFLADTTNVVIPKTFVFDNVNFMADTPALTPESESIVKELSTILAAYPGTTVQVQGYSDNASDAEANQKLALDRAETIKGTLIKNGIAAPRLTTAGDEQQHPLTFNNTKDKRSANRHLELVVVKK